MPAKHDHTSPTCSIPSRLAKHAKPLISLQHARSARLAGKTRMLANAHVPAVVPRRRKYGDMPSEDRRTMMRWYCER